MPLSTQADSLVPREVSSTRRRNGLSFSGLSLWQSRIRYGLHRSARCLCFSCPVHQAMGGPDASCLCALTPSQVLTPVSTGDHPEQRKQYKYGKQLCCCAKETDFARQDGLMPGGGYRCISNLKHSRCLLICPRHTSLLKIKAYIPYLYKIYTLRGFFCTAVLLAVACLYF